MSKENKIQLFQDQSIRTHWDEDKELWYFSIIDVIAVLTESKNPQAYWRKLKQRLLAEGNETVTNCHGLKMKATDGKMRMTDVADTEQLLRLIQSIPSPKAEPFKLWLAKVGYERIEETEDPELAFDRAMATYLKKGYSKKWINQRLKSIEVRKELTDEWADRGVKEGLEYAILTNEITKAWEYGTLDDAVKKGSSNISLNKIKDDEGDYPVFSAKGFAKNVSFFQQEQEYLAIIKDGAGIGRVSKYPAKSSVVATMQYLIPKDGFDIGFIEYFLNGIDFEKHRSGSTIPHVYFKDYKSEAFPLVQLPEQQRIVEILDKAFLAIDKAKQNAQQNLSNAKEVFESYLQGVFENGKLKVENGEWEEKTLKQVSEDFGRGKSKHRPRNDKKLYGGDYPFIQTGNIRNCEHYITDYSQTYNNTGLAQSKLWPTGTICITIAANIAETGILSFDACFPDSVIGIVVNTKITNVDFVEYLLRSFKVNLQSLGKGSAQDNINMGTFENKLFPFPSIKEQKKIVQELNNLSAETQKLETIYQQKTNNLDELKKSILQKAFTGELTP